MATTKERKKNCRLVSIKKTGSLLGIGRSSVYKLINEKRVVKVKVGRRTLITFASIEALVADAASREGL